MNPPVVFPEESLSESRKLDLAVLSVFATFVCLWSIGGGPPLSEHEAIVAQGAREMRLTGDWLIPRLGDAPFVRKPPLAYWLAAVASMIVDLHDLTTPVSPLAARLPAGIAALLTTWLVYVLGRAMFGHRIGIVSGAVMSTSIGTLFFSHDAQVEMVLTFCCTACFACFWLATETQRSRRLFLFLFYCSLGLAMLAKAPLPIGVVGLPLAAWWFLVVPLARLSSSIRDDAKAPMRRQLLWAQLCRAKQLWVIPGLLIFLAIFLPWPIYVYSTVPNVLDLWRLEYLARLTGDLYGENHPVWYYIPIALGLIAPFSLSLPEAALSPFIARYSAYRRPLLYLLTWVGVSLVFLSTSPFKVPRYLVVCVPGFALLLGPTLDRLFFAGRTFSARGLKRVKAAIVAGVCIAVVIGGVVYAKNYPETAHALWIAGSVAILAALVLCATFVPTQRIVSLVVLYGATGIGFAASWDMLGLTTRIENRTMELVHGLDARAIGYEDRITWVSSRPDASVLYYAGRRMRSLFSDAELAPIRQGRRSVSAQLREDAIRRVKERLGSDREEYFVLDANIWNIARERAALDAREVFRVHGRRSRANDDVVVITNEWNTGEWEKIFPHERERDAKLATVLPPQFAALAPGTAGVP